MTAGRQLPQSLTSMLRQVRALEAAAAGTHRERAAIRGTSALLLAAYNAGWQQRELAAFLGMKLQAVHKRIQSARQLYGDAQPAIVVDAPLDRPPSPVAVLRLPVADREWLTISEAAAFVGCDSATIYNWNRRGVLPNTDRTSRWANLYLRADLRRVINGPRRGSYPDFARLLALIAASPI